jgi:outer membrane protein assembly factor BamB
VRFHLSLFLILVPLCFGQSWMQWGANPQHTGSVIVLGQPARRVIHESVFDPFARLIQAENGGNLLAHYQPPLTDGRDVFVAFKTGVYHSCNPPGSLQPAPCGRDAWDRQIWGQKRMVWGHNRLRERWRFESDWKPVPAAGGLGWEPVFHAAGSERFVYVPAAGGELIRLRRGNGRIDRRFQPFGAPTDLNKYLVGPVTVDDHGTVYYNVLQLNPQDPWANGFQGAEPSDLPGAWLVKITNTGTVTLADYKTLIPSAPSTCRASFSFEQLPWPPAPDAVPQSVPCFSQRPGVNVAPAVAPDGTIYTVSRGHHPQGARYSYLIALNPDLSLKWAASLRERLRNGCGGLLPIGGPNGCRHGTPANGVDPATNELPAGMVVDLSTSSPVVAPDGSVLYGASTAYNYLRGHLFHFDANGSFLNAFDFGWDTTPAVWPHGDTYSIILKENNYPIGSYCFHPLFCPARENGPYYITQLDANLNVEWRFQNTTTEACERLDDGTLRCALGPRRGGFEWCINAPAVDVLGTVYANSEDGYLYVIGQGGKLIDRVFLSLAIGAAYTPLSIGFDGKIYTENDGRMFVIGR